MYSGKYNYIVDSKGRIFVPVKFRRGMSPESDNTFVVTRGFDKCLIVYPIEEWRKAEERLRSYPTSDIRSRRVVRWFTANAEVAKLDSQGRIKIPQHLLEFIGVGQNIRASGDQNIRRQKAEDSKEVIIIGVLNRLEIWEPQTYRDEENKSEPAGFEALPELIL